MWITFKAAAEIAGLTVGELCTELSKSGCLDPFPRIMDSVDILPNHPRVRLRSWMEVDTLELQYRYREEEVLVVVHTRPCGSVHATHVDDGDLQQWLADRSARTLAFCQVCHNTGMVHNPNRLTRDMVPCPKCRS